MQTYWSSNGLRKRSRKWPRRQSRYPMLSATSSSSTATSTISRTGDELPVSLLPSSALALSIMSVRRSDTLLRLNCIGLQNEESIAAWPRWENDGEAAWRCTSRRIPIGWIRLYGTKYGTQTQRSMGRSRVSILLASSSELLRHRRPLRTNCWRRMTGLVSLIALWAFSSYLPMGRVEAVQSA